MRSLEHAQASDLADSQQRPLARAGQPQVIPLLTGADHAAWDAGRRERVHVFAANSRELLFQQSLQTGRRVRQLQTEVNALASNKRHIY